MVVHRTKVEKLEERRKRKEKKDLKTAGKGSGKGGKGGPPCRGVPTMVGGKGEPKGNVQRNNVIKAMSVLKLYAHEYDISSNTSPLSYA